MSKLRWWALPCGALMAAATLVAPAAAEPENSAPTVRDGMSQPEYQAAPVTESVWVETGLDLDRDGVVDRVTADVRRPSNADGPVPVVMDASPYYASMGRGNESELKEYDQAGKPTQFPLFLDNYFVPRGYATVLVDTSGTNRAEGCVDIGGESDVQSAKAVVEWLNGNAKGFSAPEGGQEVQADWSTGATGMIGKSYDGTIANGVAATGVEGLKTIVPIGAISSWYDYYRSDGTSNGNSPAQLASAVENPARADCEHVKSEISQGASPEGNYNDWWKARDHVKDAANVKASVFAVHGKGDLNVKMRNFGQWMDALNEAGVRTKVWLSQAGHVDPFDFRRKEWVETLHRWFDHELLGVDNGIDGEPRASVEQAPDKWVDNPTWPAEGMQRTVLHPKSGDTPGLGQLGTEPAPADQVASFTDDPRLDEYAWAESPDQPSDARTLFTTGELKQDLRLSGTSSITVNATPSSSTAHVSAVLVDYGPATIRDYLGQGEGIRTLNTESCVGENFPGDDACYKDTETTTKDVDMEIVSRGWADLGNHASLTDKEQLNPGTPYEMTFQLAATDHVIPAGHRLGLIIGGTDSAYADAPEQSGKIDLGLAATSVDLPLVGGMPAATTAGVGDEVTSLPTVRPGRELERPDFHLRGHNYRP